MFASWYHSNLGIIKNLESSNWWKLPYSKRYFDYGYYYGVWVSLKLIKTNHCELLFVKLKPCNRFIHYPLFFWQSLLIISFSGILFALIRNILINKEKKKKTLLTLWEFAFSSFILLVIMQRFISFVDVYLFYVWSVYMLT